MIMLGNTKFGMQACVHTCRAGVPERVTLLKDAVTQHPTGKAYIQLQTVAQAAAAIGLTGSTLLQRVITVLPKPAQSGPSTNAAYFSTQPGQYGFAPPQMSFAPHMSSADSWQSQIGRGRGRGRMGNIAMASRSNTYIRPGLQ